MKQHCLNIEIHAPILSPFLYHISVSFSLCPSLSSFVVHKHHHLSWFSLSLFLSLSATFLFRSFFVYVFVSLKSFFAHHFFLLSIFSRESRLYKRVCPSVRGSVGPSVRGSVRPSHVFFIWQILEGNTLKTPNLTFNQSDNQPI